MAALEHWLSINNEDVGDIDIDIFSATSRGHKRRPSADAVDRTGSSSGDGSPIPLQSVLMSPILRPEPTAEEIDMIKALVTPSAANDDDPDSDDDALAKCPRFVPDSMYDNFCGVCEREDKYHPVCSRFRDDGRNAACEQCGRHEFDHTPCSRYTAKAPSRSATNHGRGKQNVARTGSASSAALKGRHGTVQDDEEESDADDESEGRSMSSETEGSSSAREGEGDDGECSDTDARPCGRCGRHEEDHLEVCGRFEFDGGEQGEVTCTQCGRYAIDHDLCEYYEDGELAGWCDNCGRSEPDHALCKLFMARSEKADRCDSCGRHKADHPACVHYAPGPRGLCEQCGKGMGEHAWVSFLHTHLSSATFRHDSFADIRQSTPARWYVDGRDIYLAILDGLESATEEIFIAGWFLSPELYLDRDDPYKAVDTRLDRVLARKAAQGVKVYVLLWNETKLAFKLNSGNAQRVLEQLHPNIRVITHPGATGPINWSHHQKTVVVDQDIAFLGGLDLAFGRYDTHEHTPTDPCHLRTTWPGKDFYNPSLKGVENLHRPFEDSLDRTSQTRMPWHDVHVSVVGLAARDVAIAFIQRWNHHKVDMDCGPEYCLLVPKEWGPTSANYNNTSNDSDARDTDNGNDDRDTFDLGQPMLPVSGRESATPTPVTTTKPRANREASSVPISWLARMSAMRSSVMHEHTDGDASNDETMVAMAAASTAAVAAVTASFVSESEGVGTDDELFRTAPSSPESQRRMRASVQMNQHQPSGTAAITATGLSGPSVGIRRATHGGASVAFNFTSGTDKSQTRVKAALARLSSLPAVRSEAEKEPLHALLAHPSQWKERKGDDKDTTIQRPRSRASVTRREFKGIVPGPGGSTSGMHWTDCQVLRSMGEWSGGLATEQSIYKAYIDAIEKAEHFIYIENQYFISCTDPTRKSDGPVNLIAHAILNRLRRAIATKETFRCILVLPISPEGCYREDVVIRYTMHVQYKTLARGRHSMLAILKQEFPDVDLSDFVCVCSLRSHGLLNGRQASEQVYVHSKLIIVDDKITIIGSANINDRSMNGDRDSEIAVRLEDRDHVVTAMNGKPYKAGRFAHSLRCRLWREHLGCSTGSQTSHRIIDPIASTTYRDVWLATAAHNTALYEAAFLDIPSNRIPSIKALEGIVAKTTLTPGAARDAASAGDDPQAGLLGVKGHLVLYPKEFLHETLNLSLLDWGPHVVVQDKVFF